MNELTEQKHIILMKSGLAHFVKKETADTISAAITAQANHRFIRITEINQLINSAEIEGIYTPHTYEEYQKIKLGERLCAYGTWHKKRDVCECRIEHEKAMKQWRETQQRRAERKPITEEERANIHKIIEENRNILIGKGILKEKYTPR